jgi:hypothetical protein
MNIFENLKDYKSKKTFDEMNSEIYKMFDIQKEAIKGIKSSNGYLEIKKYWQRSKDAAVQRMTTAKKSDEKAKAMYILADEFLRFLESREI